MTKSTFYFFYKSIKCNISNEPETTTRLPRHGKKFSNSNWFFRPFRKGMKTRVMEKVELHYCSWWSRGAFFFQLSLWTLIAHYFSLSCCSLILPFALFSIIGIIIFHFHFFHFPFALTFLLCNNPHSNSHKLNSSLINYASCRTKHRVALE